MANSDMYIFSLSMEDFQDLLDKFTDCKVTSTSTVTKRFEIEDDIMGQMIVTGDIAEVYTKTKDNHDIVYMFDNFGLKNITVDGKETVADDSESTLLSHHPEFEPLNTAFISLMLKSVRDKRAYKKAQINFRENMDLFMHHKIKNHEQLLNEENEAYYTVVSNGGLKLYEVEEMETTIDKLTDKISEMKNYRKYNQKLLEKLCGNKVSEK